MKLDEEYTEPRAVEAEEALLSSMTFGADAVDAALVLGVQGADFTSAAREAIYAALLALRKAGAPIEMPALLIELRRQGQDERTGGALELVRLAELVPSGANAAYYAMLVRRAARRRSIMQAALRLFRRAADPTVPDDELKFEETES